MAGNLNSNPWAGHEDIFRWSKSRNDPELPAQDGSVRHDPVRAKHGHGAASDKRPPSRSPPASTPCGRCARPGTRPGDRLFEIETPEHFLWHHFAGIAERSKPTEASAPTWFCHH